MKRGETGGVCHAGVLQQGRQDGLQPRCAMGGLARVAVLRGLENGVRPFMVQAQSLWFPGVAEGGGDMDRRSDIVDDIQRIISVDRLRGGGE